MTQEFEHISVLKKEVLDLLDAKPGESVLDCTLGLGGHAEALIQATGPNGHLTGLDADKDNLVLAEKRLSAYSEQITLIHANFGDIADLGMGPVSVVLVDLGLSSVHLDDAARGFSFRLDGPLDLRFDRTRGATAASLIEESDPQQLASIFRSCGELFKEASKLGRVLAGKKIKTTGELKTVVETSFGFRGKHIMAQVFQSLRMSVNDELGALERLLSAIPDLLLPGGRIGIISFHSLEDRLVKHAFRTLSTPEKDYITGKISVPASFALLTTKPIIPSAEEIAHNPRARSAKLRVLRRVL